MLDRPHREPLDRADDGGAVSAGRSVVRSLSRAAECGALVAWHGLRGVGRLAKSRWSAPSDREPAASIAGRTLADLCESLGATFVKMGQILSARPDLLPGAFIAPLRRLQDQVTPIPARQVPAVLDAALGRPADQVFAHFDPQPIASASIAQVHRATLREPIDGIHHVAVKLQRPAVARQITDDLRLTRTLVRILGHLPPLRPLPLREAIDEVGAAIREQLDFREEARSNRRLREGLAHAEAVRLPRPLEELSNGSVLVMEYLENLERLDRSSLDPPDLEAATLTGLRALFRMIFIDGFVHADLHPGNVFFRTGGEVVLVDTGLVARLPGRDRIDFKTFFSGMVANDGRRCAAVVERTAVAKGPRFDAERFRDAMVHLIADHSRRVTEDFEVALFVAQLFDLQRRHDLRGSTAFTMTILSLAVYEGIVKQTHPFLDFQRQALTFLVKHRLNVDE